jgi:hypothetical protein
MRFHMPEPTSTAIENRAAVPEAKNLTIAYCSSGTDCS